MVSALDFRTEERRFEPGLCRRVVSLDKKLYSTLYLFIQVYKWVLAIIMLAMTIKHPIHRGSRRFLQQKLELSAGTDGPLGS